jgi:hypothetical protein
LGLRHYYIKFDDGTTWGVYPEKVWDAIYVGRSRWNDPRDTGGEDVRIEGDEARLRQEANNYREKIYLPPWYTSNDAVREVIRRAGATFPEGKLGGYAP